MIRAPKDRGRAGDAAERPKNWVQNHYSTWPEVIRQLRLRRLACSDDSVTAAVAELAYAVDRLTAVLKEGREQ